MANAERTLQQNTTVLTELRFTCVRIEGEVRDLRSDVDNALRQIEKRNNEASVSLEKKITEGRITRREWAIATGLVIVAPILSAVMAVILGSVH